MKRPEFDLVQVDEKQLSPGQTVYWPVALDNWGSMEYQPGKWIPSAVVYVDANDGQVTERQDSEFNLELARRFAKYDDKISATLILLASGVTGFGRFREAKKDLLHILLHGDIESPGDLEGTSLAHDNLWVQCGECGQEQARDPYKKTQCVYGHEVDSPK